MSTNQGYVASNFDVRTVRQGSWSTGKKRYVWVDLDGAVPFPVYVTKGGVVQNVGKFGGKVFQGDLCEYRTDGKIYLLKTFEVAEAVDNASGTTLRLVRDEFHHVPNVGDILMKAPTSLSGKGKATAIGVPEAKNVQIGGVDTDVWEITIAAGDFGALTKGDIMVEAASAGSSVQMLVQNPNTFVPDDKVFNYSPATGNEDFEGARYSFTPVLHGVAWVNRMSKLPSCVDAINKSKVSGWFEL